MQNKHSAPGYEINKIREQTNKEETDARCYVPAEDL